MKLPPLDYICPATLPEAMAALAMHGANAKVIAGGQSLMPMLAFRLAAPECLIDIGRLPDLRHITIGAEGIDLGALVTWRDIERDLRLAAAHPLLADAIAYVAHYQVRNRGTVGGSLAHADPAAEMPGIAVACDAVLTLLGPQGTRTVQASDFFLGALSTRLEPDELIVGLRLPPWKDGRRWAFEEFSRRRGDFAMAGVALFYDVDEAGTTCDAHVGVIGVADRPLRLSAVEAVLNGRALDAGVIDKAAAAARASVAPDDDIHAEAAYRCDLVGTLLERALARAGQICMPEVA